MTAPDEPDSEQMLYMAASGDPSATAILMDRHRGRLKKMVAVRLDPRLTARVDPSDIVQDALVDASRRLGDYAKHPTMGFFLWLRWLTGEKLLNTHRQHLGTQKRDVAQEVSIYRRAMPEANSISLAQQLLGQITSPTRAVMRAEIQLLVQEVLNSMDPFDREILVLRNYEQLSTSETAEALGIKRSTAGKRYIAALKRLRQALGAVPGLQQHFQ